MGKYQLIRKLATGGMAEVFLAKAAGPMGFEKTLVVKRILSHLAEDPQFIEMFLAEAKLAALLNHAQVAHIFDFGEADGSYFIAMEYVDGPNLRVLSRRALELKTPISLPLCARLISYACEGLSYAHELADPESGEPLGLIHRDVSADNIMLSRSGGVKVVDFGIAKAANQIHKTRTGIVKGKVAYMSPEQLKNEPLDPRTDVYALGVVLYELVVGRKPFEAESDVGLMRAILDDAPKSARSLRKDVPPELDKIITKALAKSRDKRYANCRALQQDLDLFLIRHGTPVGALQLSELVKTLTLPAANKAVQAPPQGVQAPPAPPSPELSETEMVVTPPQASSLSSELAETGSKSSSRARVGVTLALGILLVGAMVGYIGWRMRGGETATPPVAAATPPVTTASPATEPRPETKHEEPASSSPPLASFVVESVPPGNIAVDGKPMGASPVRMTEVKPGELRIETSGPDFAREERFTVKPGDNGTLRLVVEKGQMKIRGLPVEAPVTLDGRLLGSLPPPMELYEGPHKIEVMDPKTQKLVPFDCPRLPPHESRICKFKLESE